MKVATKYYGLIGKNIDYSFSKRFFTDLFEEQGLDCRYDNFDLPDISHFPEVLAAHKNLVGLNVTIPYKEAVLPYLDEQSPEAAKIGAVNTVKIGSDGRLIGYNTDAYGFEKALLEQASLPEKTALILGTGGASKAVAYVLEKLGYDYCYVSRQQLPEALCYHQLTEKVIQQHKLIVNTTPLGTYPNTDSCPSIPYAAVTSGHLLFDLVYRPPETLFLQKGRAQGAHTVNGFDMLCYQALRSWELWNLSE